MRFKIKSLAAAMLLMAVHSIQAADKREIMQLESGVAAGAIADARSSGAPRFIDPALFMMQTQAQSAFTAAARGTAKSQSKPTTPSSIGPQGLTMKAPALQNGLVAIEALSKGDDAVLMRELAAAGAQDVRQSGNVIAAKLSPMSVDALRAVSSAQFIRAAPGRAMRIGKVTSQGDPGQKSDVARNRFNVNGKGATVGILSDSWNATGGAPAGIASGDLPGPGNPNGFTNPANILKDAAAGQGSDEGRAMGEIIHDVAPGAKLSFYGPENLQDHADGVRKLAAAGATVIVDDIEWFADPWYQPGPINLAARDVLLRNNTVVVSSAGNESNDSAEAVFKARPASDVLVNGGSVGKWELQDWGNGAATIPITLTAGADITFLLQWDEPFASASLNRQGSRSDLDLFIFAESQGVNLLFASASDNLGGDAVEVTGLSYNPTDPNATATIYLTVGRLQGFGQKPRGFKLKINDNGAPSVFDKTALFNKPTVLGHSASEWIISSCAVRYDRINDPTGPRPQLFSSVGGFARTRDQFGNRLPFPIDTKKPDVCSPNGGNTTFFVPGLDFEPDGFPNFFGTSASAPHAAGVAALMQEASGMKIPAFAIGPLMRLTAIDMDDPFGTPDTFDKGYDTKTGAGFLDANNAVHPATFFKNLP